MANLPTLALSTIPAPPSPSHRGALTARPHGQLAVRPAGALTHRRAAEEEDAFSSLGKGTVGLGPDCNVQLKKFDKDLQREWLKTRTGMLARAHAEKQQDSAASPRDRYAKYKEEMETQKERKEVQLDKARLKNASAKKASKEQHSRWREQQQLEKSARVKANREASRHNLQTRWQYRTHRGVWYDFSRSDTDILCKLEDAHGQVAHLPKVELPDFGGDIGPHLAVDYQNCIVTVPEGGPVRMRKRWMVESNHKGDMKNALSSEVGKFKELCHTMYEQMRHEMDEDISAKREHNERERARKEQRRTQSPDHDDTLNETRDRVQAEKKRAAKAAKRHKEKAADLRRELHAEMKDERARQRTRKEEREEQLVNQLQKKMRAVRQSKQEDIERRRLRDEQSLSEKRQKILEMNSSRQSWLPPGDGEAMLSTIGSSASRPMSGVALSKGQVYVRDARLQAAQEQQKVRSHFRAQRLRDDESERNYRLYLGSTVRKPDSLSPSKPASPPSAAPRRHRADDDDDL